MIWAMKHWKGLLSGLLLVMLAGGWWADRRVQYAAGHAAATAEISAELAKSAAKHREAAHEASAEYQAVKAKSEEKERIRYVQIQKIIERPVYRDRCLDSDGLRLINEAVNER